MQYENSYGKTEMWYIVDAAEGAGIYCGFRKDTSKEEFLRALAEGKAEQLLNFIPVKKGESYFIAAGTVHAIGAGCLICEIQQNSNLTYRVYDYDRRGADGKPRELHVDRAVKAIDFKKYAPTTFEKENIGEKAGELLGKCDYFRVRRMDMRGEFRTRNADSFSCLTAVDGAGKINGEAFKKGDSYFIPCGVEARLSGEATLVLTDVPPKENEE